MADYTLISFYTQEWKYKKYALNLIDKCNKLGIKHLIKELPSTGCYMDNTKLKTAFIKECLETLKSPVLWVDCDSHVLKKPVFFDTIPQGVTMAAKKKPEKNKLTWYVAVLWFDYCEESLDFINRWIAQSTGTIGGDHTAMERAWREKNINAIDIPEDYAVVLKKNEQPRGTISLTISDWPQKNSEMKETMIKVKAGLL